MSQRQTKTPIHHEGGIPISVYRRLKRSHKLRVILSVHPMWYGKYEIKFEYVNELFKSLFEASFQNQ